LASRFFVLPDRHRHDRVAQKTSWAVLPVWAVTCRKAGIAGLAAACSEQVLSMENPMSDSSIYALPPPWPNQALALSKEASQVNTREMVKQSAETKSAAPAVSNGAPASTTEPVAPATGSGVNVVA
jgi:hypothetical protein